MQVFKNYHFKLWHYMIMALSGLFLFYTCFGFWGIPWLLKPKLVEQLEQILQRPVSLDQVEFHPFALVLTLKNLTIQEPDATNSFIELDELVVNLQSHSLLQGALVLHELKLTGLAIHLIWQGEDRFNFSDLLPQASTEPSSAPSSAPEAFLFSIHNIQLLDSRITLNDQTKNRTHAVEELQLTIPQVSNLPQDRDAVVQASLSTLVNQTQMSLQVQSKIFQPSQETEAILSIQEVSIPDYMEYIPIELNFNVVSGLVRANSQMFFAWSDSQKPKLELTGEVGLRNLKIAADQKKVLELPEAQVTLVASQPLEGNFHVGQIALNKLLVNIQRKSSGDWNLLELVPAQEPNSEASDAGVPADSDTTLQLKIDRFQLSQGQIHFLDQMVVPAFTTEITPVDLTVDGFQTTPETSATVNFSAQTTNKEIVKTTGKFQLDPLQWKGNVQVTGVDLPKYAAYYAMLPVLLKNGALSVDTNLHFMQEQEDIKLQISGKLSLQDLDVWDSEEKPLLSWKDAVVEMDQSEPLLQQFHLANVQLNSPELHLTRDHEGVWNLLNLAATSNSEATSDATLPTEEETSPKLSLRLGNLLLQQGKVFFADQFPSESFETEITDMEMEVSDFNLTSNTPANLRFSAQTELQEQLQLEGVFSLTPMTWQGTAQASQIHLKKYAPYYQNLLRFQTSSGELDVRTSINFSQEEQNQNIYLSDLAVELNNLKLLMPNEQLPLLDLPHFSISQAQIDLSRQQITINRMRSNDAKLSLILQKDHTVNWQHLLQPTPVTQTETAKDSSPMPWQISLKQGDLENYAIHFTDQTLSQSFQFPVSKINLHLNNFATSPGKQAQLELSMLLNQSRFTIEGNLGIAPLQANLRLGLDPLHLPVLQPYVPDPIKLLITNGTFATTGTFSLSTVEQSPLPRMTYQGEMSLKELVTVEKGKNNDFLKWKNFQLVQLDTGFNPFYLNIDEVKLEGVDVPFILHADGTNNMAEIFGGMTSDSEDNAAQPSSDTPTLEKQKKTSDRFEAPQVNIRKAAFKQGEIRFIDHNLTPPYVANLQELEGSVFGLTEIYDQPAKVLLKGSYNAQAPVQVVGTIHPLRDKLFLDFEIQSRGIDMSSFSSYSGRYLGYAIQKGQLSLDLKYKIAKNQIQADNKIFLDQFTLGEEVESKDAVSLPIRLALAVLKDRNGEIHLDLPVKGNLDDPQFSVAKIVGQAFVNLIEKVAAAPFTILGNLLGEQETLNRIDFPHGQFELDLANQEKLAKLARVLQKRPQLDLEIEGYYDEIADRKVLQQNLIDRRLRLEKQKTLLQQGQIGIRLQEILLTDEERTRYLEDMYRKTNPALAQTPVSVEKMENWLLSQTLVTREDLDRLGQQRALSVRSFFIEKGEIASERIFLTDTTPPTDSPNIDSQSRVELRLK